MALWSVAILELKSSWNIWPKWCWKRNSWYLSTNVSPTSVTNIKIEEALRLTLNKSFAFFDISCRNDPTASQRKIMKIISVRYFTAIFKKPFTKLIEFFRLLILKSFKNLHFLAHFSSKSKIFQDHLKVGKHFYCTCIKYIFEINDSVSIIYKSFIWYIYLLRWIQLYFCYLLVFSSY